MSFNFKQFIPYFFGINFAFYAVVSENIYTFVFGMANNVDLDQTGPSGAVWAVSAQFAYAILSETLVYKILWLLPFSWQT